MNDTFWCCNIIKVTQCFARDAPRCYILKTLLLSGVPSGFILFFFLTCHEMQVAVLRCLSWFCIISSSQPLCIHIHASRKDCTPWWCALLSPHQAMILTVRFWPVKYRPYSATAVVGFTNLCSIGISVKLVRQDLVSKALFRDSCRDMGMSVWLEDAVLLCEGSCREFIMQSSLSRLHRG